MQSAIYARPVIFRRGEGVNLYREEKGVYYRLRWRVGEKFVPIHCEMYTKIAQLLIGDGEKKIKEEGSA